jgi:phage terminase large subunit
LETGHKYKYTRAYFKIRDLILSNPQENVFVIRGGQGASKTVSIVQLIIQSLLNSEKEATILSSELSKMKRTVIRDYRKICKDWGVFQTDGDFNKTESKHDYPNDSYLDFLGADVADVGKGFRRDILYINEADKLDIETAVQFISRAKLTIIDYNPDKLFWGDDYINENNFLTLTFEDNEYLPESEVKAILDYKTKGFFNPDLPFEKLFEESNIKSKYWANKWKVYGLGMVGALEGVVFENWAICENIPPHARLLGYGLDWGYTNHPTALVGVYYADNKYYLDQVIHETNIRNPQTIIDKMEALSVGKYDTIAADSAELMGNNVIRLAGWRIVDVKKPPNSRVAGVSIMQDKFFMVPKRCTKIIEEFQKYIWAVDRNGVSLNEPIKLWDDALDATRYHFMNNNHSPDAPRFHI